MFGWDSCTGELGSKKLLPKRENYATLEVTEETGARVTIHERMDSEGGPGTWHPWIAEVRSQRIQGDLVQRCPGSLLSFQPPMLSLSSLWGPFLPFWDHQRQGSFVLSGCRGNAVVHFSGTGDGQAPRSGCVVSKKRVSLLKSSLCCGPWVLEQLETHSFSENLKERIWRSGYQSLAKNMTTNTPRMYIFFLKGPQSLLNE